MKLDLAGCYVKVVFAQIGAAREEPGVEVPGEWGRAGMMLNILQSTGQSPTAKSYPAPNANSAKVAKPCSRDD